MHRLILTLIGLCTVTACQEALAPDVDWGDACHAASRRHMDCGASLLEAGRAERICREGGACVANVIRQDAVDPLMKCMQSSCGADCAQTLEDELKPLDVELEVLAASQRRDECKLPYDVGRFGRLVNADIWGEMLSCWDREYCLDIKDCLASVQHERFSACVEPLHLVLLTRPMPNRSSSRKTVVAPRQCKRMCSDIERSCRAACRPQSWSPNMRTRQDACESNCNFARFSCDSDCGR
jgi:hypothetical protein